MVLVLAATLDGKSLPVLVDPLRAQNALSTRFALVSNVPRQISFGNDGVRVATSALLRVPTVSDWFQTMVTFPIGYVGEYDAVLGNE